MSFAAPGAYGYVCVIHPTMTGTVTVVAEGETADSPEDVRARGDDEMAQWLEEGRAAKAELLAKPLASEANDDGSTTWFVEMGATTLHTDILAFQPVEATIAAGDSVVFVNNSGAPHTASFPEGNPVSPPGTPGEELAVPGPSPLTLTPGEYLSTGFVPPDAPPGGGPPLEVRQFTVVIPEAGSFGYICLLHVPSGMQGVVTAE
jgi:plastocyanin